MEHTKLITVHDVDTEKQELLIALLNYDNTLDGVEQHDHTMDLYITEQKYNDDVITTLLPYYTTVSTVPTRNWNALWESNFEPVQVDHFCGIRAHFHPPILGVTYELLITPKMSFGTGHHATTYMVIKAMETTDIAHKTVADYGTGTGVLAILAAKLSAAHIVAIDNDDWSIENTIENIANNNCKGIEVVKGEHIPTGKYDIILANINKNVLLMHMKHISNSLATGGTVILSGILTTDEQDMTTCIQANGLQLLETNNKNNWLCIIATKLT